MKTARYLITALVLVFGLGMFNGVEARVKYVRKAPPARKVVVKTKSPYKNGVWVKGHWEWRNGMYAWNNGKWVKPKKDQKWVDGHWRKTHKGWVWVKGHWRK